MAHRARHTYELSNKGVDVSVTYGFLSMLRGYIKKWRPTSVVACFDGGIPEFRRRALPCYKANRHVDEDPIAYEDFIRQMRELHDYALPMMGITVVRARGVEGDDLMYHASRILEGESIIISGDKDLLQCCTDNVKVFNPNPKREKLYDRDAVEEEFGVPFKRFLDWRAIQGDSSDNIPGVVGIGEKTATKLIKEFGDLSGIYNAAMDRNPVGGVSDKLKFAIIEFGWQRLVNNILVTALYMDRTGSRKIVCEAIDASIPYDRERVKKYLYKNAFVSLLDVDFLGGLSKLSKPTVMKDARIPIIMQQVREPVL